MDDFRQVISTGQLTSADTVTLARAAAEAIRGLNRATRCDAGLGQPSAAYDVTGALMLAASRLPQLITPAPNIRAAGIFLGDARARAAALASDLDQAQQQLAAINASPAPRDARDPS